MVLWFYIQEHPNAQSAVVLAFKLLRRRRNDLKSHRQILRTWESNLRPLVYMTKVYPLHQNNNVCGFPWYKPVPPG